MYYLKRINERVSMFFKQMTKDLSVFSSHAHRNTIDASDVECLLRRYKESVCG